MKHAILIVDDQIDIRDLLSGILSDEGYEPIAVESGERALESIKARRPCVVLLDVWLANPRFDGVHLLDLITQSDPSLPVIMISGHSTIETAVSALKKGAYDFIEKPFKTELLLSTLARAVEFSFLKKEVEHLRGSQHKPQDIVGVSAASKLLKTSVEKASKTNGRVLIQGSSGVGKTHVARLIHEKSARKNSPFCIVSCLNASVDQFEKKMLGTERELGVLEAASRGTVYLDGVHAMSRDVQIKFLQMLREERFGAGSSDNSVRFVSGATVDLMKLVQSSLFQQDLYHRLNVIPMIIPDLCDRCEDIIEICNSLIVEMASAYDCAEKTLTQEAKIILQSYDWPGNIRQLRNVIEWIFINHLEEKSISPDMLPQELLMRHKKMVAEVFNKEKLLGLPLKGAREEFERMYLSLHIHRFSGNIAKTSQFIGMDRTALHRKIRQLGMVDQEVVDSTVDISQ